MPSPHRPVEFDPRHIAETLQERLPENKSVQALDQLLQELSGNSVLDFDKQCQHIVRGIPLDHTDPESIDTRFAMQEAFNRLSSFRSKLQKGKTEDIRIQMQTTLAPLVGITRSLESFTPIGQSAPKEEVALHLEAIDKFATFTGKYIHGVKHQTKPITRSIACEDLEGLRAQRLEIVENLARAIKDLNITGLDRKKAIHVLASFGVDGVDSLFELSRHVGKIEKPDNSIPRSRDVDHVAAHNRQETGRVYAADVLDAYISVLQKHSNPRPLETLALVDVANPESQDKRVLMARTAHDLLFGLIEKLPQIQTATDEGLSQRDFNPYISDNEIDIMANAIHCLALLDPYENTIEGLSEAVARMNLVNKGRQEIHLKLEAIQRDLVAGRNRYIVIGDIPEKDRIPPFSVESPKVIQPKFESGDTIRLSQIGDNLFKIDEDGSFDTEPDMSEWPDPEELD